MTDTAAEPALFGADLPPDPAEAGPLPMGRADAVVFAVADAERAARRYCAALGLRCTAYAGPETGEPELLSYVLAAPGTRIVLTSPVPAAPPGPAAPVRTASRTASRVRTGGPRGRELTAYLDRYGDGVLDLAVSVPDVYYAYDYAVDRGALSLAEPYEARDDYGAVVLATIGVPGGTRHTLVDRAGYVGPYLPGYVPCDGL
ncbi:VOC family protein [Kitasatospora sp. MY 5-36]|uniref:VOC family protein n=1 Tax=Kitasatospora sp. MY 5-36 TaxID=1678027 RepID=UPI00067149BB|nr:VOC family protein [Kitasatospora sp. MY 5-36]